MAKTCYKHKNEPSATMCHQCHKPLCKSCVMVTPSGSFCSSECSVLYREMKEKLGGGKKKGGSGKKLLAFLLLIIAAVFGIHFAAKKNPDLKRFDLLQKLLEKWESARPADK